MHGAFEEFDRCDGHHPPGDESGYPAFLRANGYDSADPGTDYVISGVDAAGHVASGWHTRNVHLPAREEHSVQNAMPRDAGFKQALCADFDGFSLHAAVRCGADERQALEQLCRYITRLTLANKRVQCNTAGQLVLKLKTRFQRRLTCTQVMS
jgi:hypothetical protein